MCISEYVYRYVYVCVFMGVRIYTYGHILECFSLIYPFSCFSCSFFSSFSLLPHFRSDMRDRNQNTSYFLPVLCYPSHCRCYSYLHSVIIPLNLLNIKSNTWWQSINYWLHQCSLIQMLKTFPLTSFPSQ